MSDQTEQGQARAGEASPLLQLGRAVLAQQPFSAYLGAELLALDAGRAELALTVTEQLKQQHGFAHGGVLSYLVDNAVTFAGGSVLGPNVLTQEYKVSYLRPATGGRLLARASVQYRSRRQAVCRCDVYSLDGEREVLCATALGTVLLAERSLEGEGPGREG